MNEHGIRNERVISRGDASVELELDIPADSDFFDGHFPQYRLLPAVGQFALIARFARKYFGIESFIPKIRRMKFSSPILPGSTVLLSLQLDKGKQAVSFSLLDAGNREKVHSTGAFSVVLPPDEGPGL